MGPGRRAASSRGGLVLGAAGLLALGGCESLWAGFTDPNGNNCVINPGLCGPGTVCSERTKRCERTSDAEGGVDLDGGAQVDGGSGADLAVPPVFPAAHLSCRRPGFCLHTPMTTGTLRGVLARSASDIWAAGGDVLLHWDGSRWVRVNHTEGYADLVDLGGARTGADVFVLSRTGALYRWDGAQVTRLAASLPDGSRGLERLFVVDPTHLWAVGAAGGIFFWNGSAWTAEASRTTLGLRGVWGLGSDAMWAVGERQTVLRRTDASGWSAVVTPAGTAALNGVWGLSASSLWAVGDGGIILSFSGTGWAPESSTVADNLTAITGGGATSVFAVAQSGAVLVRGGGGTWSSVRSTSRALLGASAVGSDVFVVGAQGLRGAYRSSIWSQSESDTLPRPNGLTGFGDDAAGRTFAVGAAQGGSNLATWTNTGAMWIGGSTPVQATLRGASFATATDATTVGDAGTCGRWNGSTWGTCSTTAGGKNLYAVWMDPKSTTNGWAVGQGGTVMRWNGTTWNSVTNNQTADLYGVFGDAVGDAWAVGGGGLLLRCSGVLCSPELNPAGTGTLRAVFVAPSTDTYAVGDGGVILRRPAAAPWQQLTSSTKVNLYALWGYGSPSTLHAVGAGGTVLRSTDGTTWTALPSDVKTDLTGIGGTDGNNLWAVGPDAGWLRYLP